jgi:hypothetical protein
VVAARPATAGMAGAGTWMVSVVISEATGDWLVGETRGENVGFDCTGVGTPVPKNRRAERLSWRPRVRGKNRVEQGEKRKGGPLVGPKVRVRGPATRERTYHE